MKRPISHTGDADAPEFFSPQVSEARRFYLEPEPAGARARCPSSAAAANTARPITKSTARLSILLDRICRARRGSLKLQSRRHSLQPGSVFSYGPGVRQDIAADPAEPPVKYFVDFAGLKSKEILRRCHLPPGSVSQIFPPNEIQNLFDELIRCGQRGARQSAELCAKAA